MFKLGPTFADARLHWCKIAADVTCFFLWLHSLVATRSRHGVKRNQRIRKQPFSAADVCYLDHVVGCSSGLGATRKSTPGASRFVAFLQLNSFKKNNVMVTASEVST